jgi:putative membrane protein
MIAAIALAIPLSAIGALYPENTWLQVGPVALLLPAAWWALRRYPISDAAAGCLAAFVLLHLFAARWSYSFVPYDQWLPGLGSAFGSTRNMFDYGGLRRRPALIGAALFVLAVGGFYEIFEWTLTLALAPADAGAYNGEQGDMFDSQKDMAVAALGMLLALPFARTRLSS